MRGKQLFVVPLLLISLAGCPGGPKATSVSPGPLQSSPSATPSITPTTQKPVVTVTPSSPSATTPTVTTSSPATCPQRYPKAWNTAPKDGDISRLVQDPITNVTVGTDPAQCADYVFIWIKGNRTPGFRAEYVNVVTADGSGNPVPTQGKAALQLVISAPDANPVRVGSQLHSDRAVRGDKSLRQVLYAGSFEGQTTFAIGVADKRPFTVEQQFAGGQVKIIVAISHN